MAIPSSDGKYVTVEQGDSLWKIAEEFLGSGTKYTQLATINKLQKPNLIHAGDKIYLTSDGSTPSTPSTSDGKTNPATVKGPFLQADVDDTLYVTWTCKWDGKERTVDGEKKKEIEKFETEWTYLTKDGVWMHTGGSDTKYNYSTCSIPENATKVKFRVLPVSIKETVTDRNTSTTKAIWTAKWSDANKNVFIVGNSLPPKAPNQPSIEIDGYKMTITLEDIDKSEIDATHIEFKIIQDDTKVFTSNAISKPLAITYPFSGSLGRVSVVVDVEAGHEYKVCCRAIRGSLESEWSKYSDEKGTIPSVPQNLQEPKALSDTDVYLKWDAVPNAIGYDIQYTTEERYFDDNTTGSNQIKMVSTESTDGYANVVGLESEQKYFFRVRAKNDYGEKVSGWSNIVSIAIGRKPAAPTTWSSTTTIIAGEPLTLYWIHCSEDNSNQTYAELTLITDGETRRYDIEAPGEYGIDSSGSLYTINEFTEEDEEGKTNSCTIDTTKFTEGVTIQWSVRTAGVTKEYGDMSVERTVDVYAPPTLSLDLFKIVDNANIAINTVDSFPFYLAALAGPRTQVPIGYHVSIVSESTYETVDDMGTSKTIRAGEAVYSKYFDVSDALLVEFSAGNVDFQNGMNYVAKVIVSMDSGLTCENSIPFTVSWTEMTYSPNVEIAFDTERYTTYLRPYCEEGMTYYYRVSENNGSYTLTSEDLGYVYGEAVENVRTATGEQVYQGTTADGEEVYYAIVVESHLVDNVTLAIYRREFDGTLTEIATNLVNSNSTYVTDPHPSLDYARYRIVATSKDTGAVSYYDAPGYYIGGDSVIIQWDEAWSSFDTFGNDDPLVEPAWSGSMLKIPYNIDVSESNSPDNIFVKYVGRKHPVGYYGTQLGESATWNVTIPKKDKETVYALRRLKIWSGDVYVREPSGVGYWASVTVSFNQKHGDPTIPVTFNVTRVEGGM